MKQLYILPYLLLMLFFGFSFSAVQAQTPQFYKQGTTSSTSSIFLNSTSAKKSQEWYDPTDFNTAPTSGLITKIYFRNTAASATGTYSNFILSFKQPSTVGAGFSSATFETGMVEALNSPSLTLTGNSTVGGWFSITLATPFQYNSSLPLVFEIQYSAYTGGITTYASDAGTGPIKKIYAATTTATTGTTHNGFWQDFGMDVMLNTACTSPPTAGTVTVTPTGSVCSGSNVTLNLSGNSAGLQQTYQWESSATSNGTFTAISSPSSSANLSINPTSTMWYRAAVTCSGNTQRTLPVQVVVNPRLAAGAYTINNNAAASPTNFQSIAAAVSALSCGVDGPVVFTVQPGSGPYTDQITIPQLLGTSATNTVTFNGNGTSIIYTTSDANNRTALILNGADHVIFDNFTIDVSAGTYGWGVILTNQADSNVISNCVIRSSISATTSNYFGLGINGSTTATSTSGNNGNGNQIIGNTVIGGIYGIQVYGSTAPYNQNNVVKNNVILDAYSYSLYTYGNTAFLVSQNNISRPNRLSPATGYGIYLSSNQATLVEKNRIHNMFDQGTTSTSACYALYVAGTGLSTAVPNRMENNLVYNINNGGGTIYGIYGASYNNWNYYHNTIVLDDAAATAGTTYGMYVYGTGVNVKNNIVYITRGGTGTKYCLYYSTTGVTTSNNNDLYITPGSTNNTGYYSTAYPTLANWQSANSGAYDQQSVAIDPGFTQGATDYKPTNLALDNLGTAVGVTTDILNVTRSTSSPDIGAYEITAPICTSPPTAGQAAASVSGTVCPGSTVTLSLTGNSTGTGQTYQWESSTTSNGTYSFINTSQDASIYNINPTASMWYRAAVTCGGNTVRSLPVQVTVASLFPAGTYTINNTRPVSASNFQSIAAAASAVSCGISGPVVFNVEAGTGPYTDQITIPHMAGGSEAKTITFNGNNNTILYNTSDAANRAAVILNGADHVIFDNFTIDVSGGTYGWGIVLTNQADSNVISNCVIRSSNSASTSNYLGIAINGSATATSVSGNNGNGNVIMNNTIMGGIYALQVYGSTSPYNTNNVVKNNVIQDAYSYSLYTYGQSNLTVSQNNISRPNRAAPLTGYGIYLSFDIGTLVEKNRVHNMFDGGPTSTSACYALYVAGTGTSAAVPNKMENNLVYNINNGGGTIYGIYGAGYNNWNYYHNTIVLDDAAATAGTTYGMYVYGTAVNVKNNIVYITRGGSGTKYCLYYSATGVTTSNNNDLYITAGATNYTGYYNAGYTTLASWQAANSAVNDQQSVAVDPGFPTGGTDYKPTNTALDNKGAVVSVLTDITNANRSTSNPDLGSYEFGTVPVPVTLMSFTARRNGPSNTLGWTTSQEINSNYYAIERSTDGRNFLEIGRVSAAGNSQTQRTYSFNDNNPVRATNYYRLRMVDIDNTARFSEIRNLRNAGNAELVLYPNPVKAVMKVQVDVEKTDNGILTITNLNIQEIFSRNVNVTPGTNTIDVDVTNFSSGSYILRIQLTDDLLIKKFSKL